MPANPAGNISIFKHVGECHQEGDCLQKKEHMGSNIRSRRQIGSTDDGIRVCKEDRCKDKRCQPGYLTKSIPVPQLPYTNQPKDRQPPLSERKLPAAVKGG